MASELAAYYVSIVPSAKGLSGKIAKEFSGIDREASKSGKSSGGAFSGAFKSSMAGIAGAFAAVGIGSFVKDAVSAAGNLEQSMGAVSSVFGKSAGDMRKWSKNAATNVGLTANEFNELGTLIGSQLKNGGVAMDKLAPKTNELITLGADLSSMFGGSAKDAVDALSSALKGERDPIERYGVSLNQAKIDAEAAALGFEKVGGALSAEATQAATMSLIMKQTTDAHGNFAKESDTFAHKQQVASARWGDLTTKIGEVFLPVFAGVIGFFSEKAMPIIGEIVGGVKAFGAAFSDSGTDVTSSGIAGFLERMGLGLGGIWEILSKGDFSGKLAGAFGWEEDHPMVDFLFNVRSVITEVTGGINAFGAAWVANDGEITSSGFPGFMENLAFQLRQAFEYVKTTVLPKLQELGAYLTGTVVPAVANFGKFLWDNRAALVVLGIALISYVATMKTMAIIATVRGWITAAAAAQWGLNAAMAANPIGLIVAGIAALVAGLIWFFTQTDVGKAIVANAWAWIQSAIAGVVDWFNNTAMPIIQEVIRVVGAVFTWLYNNVIKPVWDGIMVAVNAAWLVMRAIFQTIHAVITKVIGPAFNWFWTNVIQPVFGFIGAAISFWWNNIVMPVFQAVWGFLKNTLGPVFDWLWKTIIKPAFDGIGTAIKFVWDKVIKPVFDTIKTFITKTIPDAFNDGVKFIKTHWDKIQDIAKAPIKFVIDTVINDGLINSFNTIAGVLGIDKLPRVALPPGFAHGGYTGDGGKYEAAGVVHKGEYVFTKEQTAALGKDRLAAMAKGAAVGAPGAGSLPFIQGQLQAAIARTGRLNLVPFGGFPMGDLAMAARAWNGRAGVTVAPQRRGSMDAGSNSVHTGFGPTIPGAIGYYSGRTITLARNNALHRETLIHEVGHALGIHHNTGNSSIMHPMLRGGGAVWPTAYDTANLRALYGAPGSGARPAADDGGKGGGFNPVEGIIDGLVKKFRETFKNGGFIADLAIGIGKKLVDSASKWVGGKLGFGQSAPAATLYDGGGWLENTGGAQLVQHNKRKPDAVLSSSQWDTMSRIADNSRGAGVTFTGPVHVRDENELASIISTRQRDAQAAYGF